MEDRQPDRSAGWSGWKPASRSCTAATGVYAACPRTWLAFVAGDRLVVVQDTGALLHVPAAEHALADAAVDAAHQAFAALGRVPDDAISAFFEAFAAGWRTRSCSPDRRRQRRRRRRRGRAAPRPAWCSPTDAGRHGGRPAGLARRGRRARPAPRAGRARGWRVEQRRAPLGVVGFVFEGRPNVFADATGVLRGGNTVVFRIGSDALGTARAIVEHALAPALAAAGLPAGAAVLLDSPSRAAGWALFAHPRPRARGRARAPGRRSTSWARSPGRPASRSACTAPAARGWSPAPARRRRTVRRGRRAHSLDRKVCNTLNVCCIPEVAPRRSCRAFLDALDDGRRAAGAAGKLHVAEGQRGATCPPSGSRATVTSRRAEGEVDEPLAEPLADADLGLEWEWEEKPGGLARRRRRRRRRRRPVQPATARASCASLVTEDAGEQRALLGGGRRARSSATASPAGSTASSRSTGPSSACPTGRTAGCSPAAASCPATPCSRCGRGPSRPTPTCTADRAPAGGARSTSAGSTTSGTPPRPRG